MNATNAIATNAVSTLAWDNKDLGTWALLAKKTPIEAVEIIERLVVEAVTSKQDKEAERFLDYWIHGVNSFCEGDQAKSKDRFLISLSKELGQINIAKFDSSKNWKWILTLEMIRSLEPLLTAGGDVHKLWWHILISRDGSNADFSELETAIRENLSRISPVLAMNLVIILRDAKLIDTLNFTERMTRFFLAGMLSSFRGSSDVPNRNFLFTKLVYPLLDADASAFELIIQKAQQLGTLCTQGRALRTKLINKVPLDLREVQCFCMEGEVLGVTGSLRYEAIAVNTPKVRRSEMRNAKLTRIADAVKEWRQETGSYAKVHLRAHDLSRLVDEDPYTVKHL